MPDYKKMYSKLFNAITDADKILQTAQLETEKMFVEQEDSNVVRLGNPDEEK